MVQYSRITMAKVRSFAKGNDWENVAVQGSSEFSPNTNYFR
jgi:hypothetical protein